MARHKLPTNLKAVRGTLEQRREVANQPTYEGLVVPITPTELPDEGKKEWDTIYPLLKSRELVTKADYRMLVEWCFVISQLKIVREKMTAPEFEWIEYSDKGVPILSKWLIAYNHLFNRMVTLSGKFGFSPADRTRISMPKSVHDDEKLEQLYIKRKIG